MSNIQSIEIQKGVRIGLEDLVNGVSKMETAELEKLVDTMGHILAGRKKELPADREKELLEEIDSLIPEFATQRYELLRGKLRKEKISTSEHQELLQIVEFMEERAVTRIHLMAELAALRQVSLHEVAEQLRQRRYDNAEA